jgi:hypothetical protein
MKAFEILKNTAGHVEIYAHGQPDLCNVGEILHSKPSGKTRKGKM